MTDIIKAVRQFTEAVGCTTDQYNVRQTALYIGLQLEEMAEKLDAMVSPPDGSGFVSQELNAHVSILHDLSHGFKCGIFDEHVARADRAGMLDADIDLAWVTIGSAFSQGADVEGAAGEVSRANLSKLVPCNRPCCTHGIDMQAEHIAEVWEAVEWLRNDEEQTIIAIIEEAPSITVLGSNA